MSTARMPLAGLLRLRGLERDRAAQELAAQAKRAAELDRRGEELRRGLGLVPLEASDSATLQAIAASRSAAGRMLVDLQLLQQAQQSETDAAAARHRDARMRHRGVERLTEHRLADEVSAELAREQSTIDEIAGTAWTRAAMERRA